MARDAGAFVEPFLVTDGDKFNLKSHDPGRADRPKAGPARRRAK